MQNPHIYGHECTHTLTHIKGDDTEAKVLIETKVSV